MRLATLTLAILLLAGCAARSSSAAEARPIMGPDGSQMLHISCGTDEAGCFELAGQHCPGGYEYVPTAPSQHPDDHNMFVRCNQAPPGPPRPAQPYTTYPQPAPTSPPPGPSGVDVGY